MAAFKYPVGAEVSVKVECDKGDTHRSTGTIVTQFPWGSVLWYVVVLSKDGGASERIELVEEADITGRVNVRTKKNGDV
jgi:hypothetical protein